MSRLRKPVASTKKSPSSFSPSSRTSAGDVAGLAVALDAGDHRVDDVDALSTCALRNLPDQRLVEMEGVVERPERDQRAVGLARVGRLLPFEQRPEQVHVLHLAAGGDGIDVEIVRRRARRRRDHLMRIVDRAVIGVALAPPVLVADAELEGRLGLAEELELVDPEMLQEDAERRGRRLADARRSGSSTTSTTEIRASSFARRALSWMMKAAIQPAVPPPTMTK